MKITKDQWKRIEEINEMVKSLDPILKKRIIDYELQSLFGDDFLKVLAFDDKGKISPKVGFDSAQEGGPSLTKERTGPSPTIKEFFDEKNPASSVETVTVFGCYIERYENKEEFTEADISRAYYEARARKPKVIGQALRDAKNIRGYLVEGSKRGRFRLSNIGENLVLHDLPRKG
jgi:hypothetical protein